jgi:hypothetical protein
VDKALTGCVTEQLTKPDVVKKLLSVAIGRVQGQDTSSFSAADRTEHKIGSLKQKLNRLLVGYEDGAIDLNTYRQRKLQLEKEIGLLEADTPSGSKKKETPIDIPRLKRLLVRGAIAFARASSRKMKRLALQRLFAEVEITDEGVKGFRLMPQFLACVPKPGIHSDTDSSRPRA